MDPQKADDLVRRLSAALRGTDGHNGRNGYDERIGSVLEQVWFAALVGWGGGLHDQGAVIEHVRTAAALMITE